MLQTGLTGAQPSQSQGEQPAPHWPEEPHWQLHSGLGGGGGDGAGAQPSQSHDEQLAPHWPVPPQAQLQKGFGGGGGDEATGFERARALSGDGTATQELPSGQTMVHAPSARSVDFPTSSPGPLFRQDREIPNERAESQTSGEAVEPHR